MTAQPTSHRTGWWSPDPRRQRLANHTVEDVLALPDDAPRVELRDGVMIVVPSPTIGHQRIGYLLCKWFESNAPSDVIPVSAVGVATGVRNTLEPDVLLLRQPAELANHYSVPEQVVIAVEIVSPSTRRRDRLEKPAEYAAAGVPFFWRIEQDPVRVFAYQLAPGDTYQLVAEADSELVLADPFEIRLSVRDITP
jgi:Uma2 family endonuclease